MPVAADGQPVLALGGGGRSGLTALLQNLADAGGVKGLEDIVVHPQLEGGHRVLGVRGGEDDLRRGHEPPCQRGHGGALHVPQVDINKQDIEVLPLQQGQSLLHLPHGPSSFPQPRRRPIQQGHSLGSVARLQDFRLGEPLANLVDQLHPGIFFVVDYRNAHSWSLLCVEAGACSGGVRGMEKETVEPLSVLSMTKGHWSP